MRTEREMKGPIESRGDNPTPGDGGTIAGVRCGSEPVSRRGLAGPVSDARSPIK